MNTGQVEFVAQQIPPPILNAMTPNWCQFYEVNI